MDQDGVVEYWILIEHQIFSQEKVLEYLLKMDSLCEVILGSDLSNYSYATIYNYFWVLNDMVRQAKDLNETQLNTLIKLKLRMDRNPSGGSTGSQGIH